MKNILLIGGSYGIGLAIAKELQYENKVFIASRTNEEIAEMKELVAGLVAYAEKMQFENIEDFANGVAGSIQYKMGLFEH